MAVEPVAAPGAEVERSGVFADFLLIRGYPDLVGKEPHAGSVETSSSEARALPAFATQDVKHNHEENYTLCRA